MANPNKSTPYRLKSSGRLLVSDSSESDQEEKDSIVIPETDHEESDSVGDTSVFESPFAMPQVSSKPRRNILLRRSFPSQSSAVYSLNESDDTQYLSIDNSSASSPANHSLLSELNESADHSDQSDFIDNSFGNNSKAKPDDDIESVYSIGVNEASEDSEGMEEKIMSPERSSFRNSMTTLPANHSALNKDIESVDHSDQSDSIDNSIGYNSQAKPNEDDDIESVNSTGVNEACEDTEGMEEKIMSPERPSFRNWMTTSPANHSALNKDTESANHSDQSDHIDNSIEYNSKAKPNEDDDIESVNSISVNDASEDSERMKEEIVSPERPRSSFIDLTQSDSSLCNTPVEARKHDDPKHRYNANTAADIFGKDSREPTISTAIPDWGHLPKPDMTISGFGRQAMQTHLAEKSLTHDALSKLHYALKSCPSEDSVESTPKDLKISLMPHQQHGLAWMLWRERNEPYGGILADDMGLGKTISLIALILKDLENKDNSEYEYSDSDSDSDGDSTNNFKMLKGGTLVVCPASVVAQWELEIKKRVKRKALSVELYHGPKREKRPHRLARFDVIITTYNLVSRESGAETAKNATKMKTRGPLFMLKWDRIILDEAHIVRNHKSQVALGVCELVGDHRWCLTGTPIQNKQLDLYALLKFLKCSPFDDLVVWRKWVDNKSAAGSQRLSTIVKSIMLRRTKQQLQGKGNLECLPNKLIEIIDVQLDREELELYEKVALFSESLFLQFLSQREEKQQALDSRYGSTTKLALQQGGGTENPFTTAQLIKLHQRSEGIDEVKTHQILTLLLRLRQICCHPGLVKKMMEGDSFGIGGAVIEDSSGLDVDLFNRMNNLNINESDAEQGPEEEVLKKCNIISADNPILSFDRPSAKIRAVLDLIQEKIADTDDKAIIVSQWTSMLNVIAMSLKQLKVKFDSLTGEVPVDKRQNIITAFNSQSSGPQILLLSLTAGGVGLNLVGANHLLLVDIHWNPQLEAQAFDRIYRVGQKKDVFIYRFITVNTVEERIKQVQTSKLALAESVLTGTRNSEASKLTLEDLKMLFSVSKPAAPEEIPIPSN